MGRTHFDQPATEEVHARHARVVASLEAKHLDVAEHPVSPQVSATWCW
ncbi:hypothetical protein ACFY4C_31390 [Actinomadura viridis]